MKNSLVYLFIFFCFAIATLLVVQYNVNPITMIRMSKDNNDAEVEASKARLEIATRRAKGEKGVIQISNCMQKPDDWEQPHYQKIPNTIFVSVASYRDDECKDTVYDMFKKAKNPELLYVGVCQQNKKQEEDCFDKCPECSQRKQTGHIRVTSFEYLEARGPCFARREASKLWRGEEYYFQIDSHLKFEQDWDETLKMQMKATGDPNTVLSAYPPTEAQMKDMKENNFTTFISMCGGKFDATGLPTITAKVLNTNGRTKPIPSFYASAGMLCFPGKALYDVPYDPNLSYLFFGEEILFTARLWTAGYNIYNPMKNFCTHHYGRDGKPKFWDDKKEAEPCKKKAIQRVKYLFGDIKKSQVHPDYFLDTKKYGMGNKRPLSDYLKKAGINFTTKTVNITCPTPN